MTIAEIRRFQRDHALVADGKLGPRTRACMDAEAAMVWVCPVAPWKGRDAEISCPFGDRRPLGPHQGDDWMHRVTKADWPALKALSRPIHRVRWAFPSHVVAAAAGIVVFVGPAPNGWRLWLQHPNRQRTAYLHLAKPEVETGQTLQAGERIGEVTFEERMIDGRSEWVVDPPHLHHGLSPIDRIRWLRPHPVSH